MTTVCLQGGGEFSPGCRAMDAELLRLVGGPVVVTGLAAEPGPSYAAATAHGVSHLRACGGAEVVGAPDVREDSAAALEVLGTARLVVLPGGSPSRLLTVLRTSPVGQLLAELVADGGGVMGASAGAMVLGAWTVLPDRRGPQGAPGVERGLGLVPGVAVIPHWSGGSSRADWLRALSSVPEPLQVLGLPEESGVLFHDGTSRVVGSAATHLVGQDLDVPPGSPLPG